MMEPAKYFAAVLARFGAENRTELYYTNEFSFAVAVILSAQTTDKMVNRATRELFAAADTPESVLNLGIQGLKEYIKILSFFNNKAKNIIALAEILAGQSAGANWKFPEKYHSRNELMKLPGIGQKTANVITNVLWNAPNIGVDTHLFRLAHRFGWADNSDNTPEKVEQKLLAVVPEKFYAITNHLMVMHGRYICKAIHPDCEKCPVKTLCEWKK